MKETKKLTKKQLSKNIRNYFESRSDYKKLFKNQEDELDWTIQSLTSLGLAIQKGYGVFAVCEKEPKGNLSSGSHYYQIYYNDIDKQTKKPVTKLFWAIPLMDKVIGKSTGRCYAFRSGAIGMSRLLAATDHVFMILSRCGIDYIQLSRVL